MHYDEKAQVQLFQHRNINSFQGELSFFNKFQSQEQAKEKKQKL